MEQRMTKHHALFNRTAWNSNVHAKALRDNPLLIVPLDVDTHQDLHEAVSYVPLLSPHIARAALYNFQDFGSTDNPIVATGNLQSSIEGAAKHPRADYIEREVARCAVHALELQKPYLNNHRVRRYV